MSDRPLSAGEKALWQKFIETVKPLDRARVGRVETISVARKPGEISEPITVKTFGGKPLAAVPLNDQIAIPTKLGLDGHWDKRLAKGTVQPDVTVDLHGHSLSSAHGRLDSALERGISAGHRTILLITGKERS
ncbi:hypothetical protein MNBD_ALPHA04-826, partial [hydrothermal vent metagenome]